MTPHALGLGVLTTQDELLALLERAFYRDFFAPPNCLRAAHVLTAFLVAAAGTEPRDASNSPIG